MKTSKIRLFVVGLAASMVGSVGFASDRAYTFSASYKEECGSCHVAYPPPLLSASSWRAVMAGLDRHFGSDASLDPAKAKEIGHDLELDSATKAKYSSVDANGRPRLRITEGEWFRREHRSGSHGITDAVWGLPSVKSSANCAACHRGAEQGGYAERDIVIPRS